MSKYGNKKVTIDGIQFDSLVEGNFYLHLLELQKQGLVKSFETQVPFILLDSYELAGRKERACKYLADFVIEYEDGRKEVVDIKGLVTPVAALKRKMFEQRYGVELKFVCYSKIDGGFIEKRELDKARKQRKKLKNKKD